MPSSLLAKVQSASLSVYFVYVLLPFGKKIRLLRRRCSSRSRRANEVALSEHTFSRQQNGRKGSGMKQAIRQGHPVSTIISFPGETAHRKVCAALLWIRAAGLPGESIASYLIQPLQKTIDWQGLRKIAQDLQKGNRVPANSL